MTENFCHNQQVDAALEALLKTDKHVFIVGSAGTGKSTLLRYFLAQKTPWQTVVVAPTGVAALNEGGENIHHFLRLRPAATKEETIRAARRAKKTKNYELYKNLDIMVIDEISMVRADLFDMMDVFLRTVRGNKLPFGGVRLICFGDLYQLPPVVKTEELSIFTDYYQTPFFFSSDVFGQLAYKQADNLCFLQLEQIYRQTDDTFLQFLDHLRHQQLSDDDLQLANERLLTRDRLDEIDNSFIILTTTKARAQAINLSRLQRLSGQAVTFEATSTGKFNPTSEPADRQLQLKKGARVMMLNNDQAGRWVNGSMGWIKQVEKDSKTVKVELDEGETVTVGPNTWEASQAVFDPISGKIEKQTIGEFRQLPLKLAWAVTIHKAQGKTFDHLIIDLQNRAFADGQAYVAFSRGTSLHGLYLVRPLRRDDVHINPEITTFLDYFTGKKLQKQKRLLTKNGSQESIF
ncbi:AAA family ATPase [bacterium]|nr:AAA family ATPase [bacterium]